MCTNVSETWGSTLIVKTSSSGLSSCVGCDIFTISI